MEALVADPPLRGLLHGLVVHQVLLHQSLGVLDAVNIYAFVFGFIDVSSSEEGISVLFPWLRLKLSRLNHGS